MTDVWHAAVNVDVPTTWSAVVVNWNGAGDLAACVAALAAQDWPPETIVVVDNTSTDNSLEVLSTLTVAGLKTIASPTNLGFAGGANLGIGATTGPFVATFNPDVTLHPTWASRIRDALADRRVAAVGGKLLFTGSGAVQHAGGTIDPLSLVAANIGRGESDDGRYDTPATVDFITGAALMMRREALAQVGQFDEAFYPAYYEDVDLCVRLRQAGWMVRYEPAAVGLHRESASVDGASHAYFRMIHAGRLRFAAKHLQLDELVGTFLPHELRRLSEALQHAGGDTAADETGLSVFPTALRRSTVETSTSRTEVTTPGTAAETLLADEIAHVGQRWLVEEKPFQTATPIIGRAIAWLRTQLNDAGPRWHVRAILAQQVDFNAAAYRALRATAVEALSGHLQAEASAIVLAERIDLLVADQQRLVDWLASLEQRLSELSAKHGAPASYGGPSPRP